MLFPDPMFPSTRTVKGLGELVGLMRGTLGLAVAGDLSSITERILVTDSENLSHILKDLTRLVSITEGLARCDGDGAERSGEIPIMQFNGKLVQTSELTINFLKYIQGFLTFFIIPSLLGIVVIR